MFVVISLFDVILHVHNTRLGPTCIPLIVVYTERRISPVERRSSPMVRTLAYHAASPGSIPGPGGVNY